MSDENYIELLEDAKDALRAVIKATEPGTGMQLHLAYTELKRSIATASGETPPREQINERQDADEARRRAEDEQRRARDFIKQTTPREREHIILGLFTEGERLTRREAWLRLKKAMPHFDIWPNEVTGALERLHASGDLRREPEPWANRYRWRYFREAKLEGPIADLQRVLEDAETGENR